MRVIVISDISEVDYVTLVFVLAYIFILLFRFELFSFLSFLSVKLAFLDDTLKFVWSYWSDIEVIFLINK